MWRISSQPTTPPTKSNNSQKNRNVHINYSSSQHLTAPETDNVGRNRREDGSPIPPKRRKKKKKREEMANSSSEVEDSAREGRPDNRVEAIEEDVRDGKEHPERKAEEGKQRTNRNPANQNVV